MSHKFGQPQNTGDLAYRYGNVFAHEVHAGWSRVTIAPSANHLSVMLDIARSWNGPFGILYVLVVSRRGHEIGRYQIPEPCSIEALELFAGTFREYFEGDARHHLWFMDVSTGSQLVYDNHNLIYSYGNDSEVLSLLKTKGFVEGIVSIPSPHQHCYNAEFDDSEDEVAAYYDWKVFPLKTSDG